MAATGVDELLVGFGRALRRAGLPVGPDRTATFADAVRRIGADDAAGVYWAGRATLCAAPQDAATYDRVFAAWFSGRLAAGPSGPESAGPARAVASLTAEVAGADAGPQDEDDVVAPRASDVELLRRRDVAELDDAQRAEVARLLSGLRVRLPRRSSARRVPSSRGWVDARASVRDQLRRGGEPAQLRWRRRAPRPRRVVMVVDVSGSMAPYAETLLRVGHLLVRAAAASGGTVEVFSAGTRLTRLTPALRRHRDAESALTAAGEAVVDWSGGTRLGEVLAVLVQQWAQRGPARGAVVVICSDGWERGGTTVLAAQAQRLRRLAHKVIWVNPHRGRPGYQPVQSGIAAVLPHVDALVAGHSLAAFEELLQEVGRA